MKIGCIILAAGRAVRFGENKLLQPFRGKPLIAWSMDAVPTERLGPVCVVTREPAVEALAAARGWQTVRNDAPELGVSRSVALGTEALAGDCDGLLFLVADQPLLRRETVERLLDRFLEAPERIAAAAAGERFGNPAVFPAALFSALMTLKGDRGGKQLMQRFPELVVQVSVDPAELADVDTAEDLRSLRSP